jgi:hypothetical protein
MRVKFERFQTAERGIAMSRFAVILLATLAWSTAALAVDRTPSPQGANAYFISPTPGDTMTSPVTIRFGLKGMGVAPAGVEKANTGHHHLIIDAPLPALDEPILKDEHYRHFGGGQTEAVVELSPGRHRLQLLLGDHNHIPHDPPVLSAKITITVE